MDPGLMLGVRILKRVILSFSIEIVAVLNRWTHTSMSAIQLLCLVALLFTAAMLVTKNGAQPRLIRYVSLFYCNQQARRLFTYGSNTAIDLFPNVLLATAIAILLITTTNRNNTNALEDLRSMLEGLLYMYGDIMDFAFEYGTIPVTTAAMGVSLLLRYTNGSDDPANQFIRRLADIISTNVLYQGATSLINSTVQTELIETIAATSIIRLAIPSTEGYLIFLTAGRLTELIPDVAPMLACLIMWVELLPTSSRGWISELCVVYVILAVARYLVNMPTLGAVVTLILAHYIDHVIAQLEKK
jgi:hypothetical protein